MPQTSSYLPLHAIAHGRAGDKGNISNISVISYLPEAYGFICQHVTEQAVLSLFATVNATSVKRYELPNLHALNFVISDALDGGVNSSRNVDRHGKTLSFLLLGRLYLDIPHAFIPDGSPYFDRL